MRNKPPLRGANLIEPPETVSSYLSAAPIAYAGCALVCGALNYAFQFVAARHLDLEQLAALQAWPSYLSLGLIVGLAAQLYACAALTVPPVLPRVGRWLVVLAVCALPFGATGGLRLLLWCAIAAIIGVHLFLGLAQRSLMFHLMAFGSLSYSGTRLLLAYLWPAPWSITQFAWAETAAGSMAAVLLVLIVSRSRRKGDDLPVRHCATWRQFGSALSVASMMALFPQVDFLALQTVAPPHVLGVVARAGLLSKVVFFGLMIAAQIQMPFDSRRFRMGEAVFSQGGWKPRLVFVLVFLGATWLCMGFLAVPLSALLQDNHREFRAVVQYASCLAFLQGVQILYVQRLLIHQAHRSCIALFVLCLAYFILVRYECIGRFFSLEELSRYFLCCGLLYASILICIEVGISRFFAIPSTVSGGVAR